MTDRASPEVVAVTPEIVGEQSKQDQLSAMALDLVHQYSPEILNSVSEAHGGTYTIEQALTSCPKIAEVIVGTHEDYKAADLDATTHEQLLKGAITRMFAEPPTTELTPAQKKT